MRRRAAFLHISKCAGTSVFHALEAAAGHPPRPDQQFDTCYVAGFRHVDELSPQARAAVAWDDVPTGVGPHVFFNHWSLPTLRRFFEPTDIATALREPMSRVLSYLEYARAIPASTHRGWYPDTLPMEICRTPLVEVLQLEPAGRAIDNLITRQVLWGDPRLPVGGFVAADQAAALAGDAVARLDELGVVALVEDMPALWASLSDWLGEPVADTHRNRTPARQVPGLVHHWRDLDRAAALLRERTAADTAIWLHFAHRAGLPDPEGMAERAVDRRLRAWCDTAFFASFHPATPTEGRTPSSNGAALDGVVPSGATLLVVDSAPADLPPHGTRTVTAVGEPGAFDADETVRLAQRELVDLRDALVGRDFDTVLVGREWTTRVSPGPLFSQLAAIASPNTTVLVVCPTPASGTDVEGHLRSAGFHDVSFVPLPDGMLAVARAGTPAAMPATHYGLPIRLDDHGDSRALVLHLCVHARTVLELGSSEGLMTRVMTERGQQVTAVEVDPAAAAAVAAHAHQVVVADLDRPDSLGVLDGQQFDTVLAADVLEHLRRPDDALRRALALLRPGGRVVLSIPNLAHADVRMALLDGTVPYASMGLLDRTHIHWFTYEGVRELLASCGLVAVGWHRIHREPGAADVPLAADLVPVGRYWFGDDPEATTFQWVVECARVGEADAVADPLPPTRPRRFVTGAAPLGLKASGRAFAAAAVRRARRALGR